MKRLEILTLIAATVLLLTFTSYMNAQVLLKPTERVATLKEPVGKQVLRSQRVEVDLNLLRSEANTRMVIPLFEGQSLTIVRDRQVPAGQRGFVWHGHVVDQKFSAVTLSVVGDVVVGTITTEKGQMYRIGYAGNGVHVITQIDPSKYPVEDYPYHTRPKPAKGNQLQDTCSTDPPSDIDVLVAYTPDALTGAGGADAMEATIYLAVEETNQSYINSGITQRLRLAHFEEVSYTESGDINTDVTRLQNPSDGYMDNVPTLRNTYAADVTALLVENGGGYCGMAYDILNPVSNAFESSAYAVVARDCATGYYSFGHELGHLMGARHDWYVDNTNNSPYAYNHGYVMKNPSVPAADWRTVMAYGNDCGGCTRVQYWSDPNINYTDGNAMGVGSGAQQSDNHQTLNNTALTVANFRCSSPGVAHVWARDTWDDTGLEPDPHTASEIMWESPYIWVRNAQDTNLTHQHEHQNPIYGQTNWVYTELHNGMASTTSGNLDIYWADGSTALQWPADWHLLQSVPVSGFTAHSTRIVEAQWSTLPGKGHFCLLARYISPSDPLSHPETANVNYNVRYNNKIVWHNVTIVDMGSSDHAEAVVNIANLTNQAGAVTLVIQAPEGEANFLQYGGGVHLQLAQPLLTKWRQAGAKGVGFHQDEKQLFVVQPEGARLENIKLNPKARTQVKVIFDRPANAPKQMYRIRVIQLQPAAAKVTRGVAISLEPKVVGGMTYEIHTDQIPK